MRILTYIVGLLCLYFTAVAQTPVQVYIEDFETTNVPFRLDTGGPFPASGTNVWVINDLYDGQPTYPNTTSQDSTVFGTISYAPHSRYLHITDTTTYASQGIGNCNFNPTAASDRFAYTSQAYCTNGLTDVKLVYFYIAEGDTVNANPNAYGEIYYSADGGPWQLAKNIKYHDQTKWRYEQIQNPAFENVSELRFGFRWVNNGTNQAKTMSFGIDDIQLIATYDEINNPVDISVDSILTPSVCPGDVLLFSFTLSSPFCEGTYRLELSAGTGAFSNPPRSLGAITLGSGTTSGVTGVIMPSVPAGGCYRLQLTRIFPAPFTTSTASGCFQVTTCNSITTQSAIVTTDPDTVCARSAIDVKFISTGFYNNNNSYIAELSDSNGSFNNPLFIGSSDYDHTAYDPSLGQQPGTVSGLVPITPEGCNYYIRIRATNPATIGTIYGPFCIKHCDMLTNNTMDITVCISDTAGIDTLSISIDINDWDSLANYTNGNTFSIQLLDMMSLSIVNTGGLGAYIDTASNTFNLIIPNSVDLAAAGIAPGSYYGRFIASNTSTPWNPNGTLIRITIGAPSSTPPSLVVVGGDTVGCPGDEITVYMFPRNPDSKYLWSTYLYAQPNIFNITPNPNQRDSIRFNFTGAPVGPYKFYVQEINNGCYGPFSDPAYFYILSSPTEGISGPLEVCKGDTVKYEVPFILSTYYEWATTNGFILDTSNNEITVVFDSVGVVNIDNYGLNACGSGTFDYDVNVVSLLDIDLGNDTVICEGEPVNLEASTDGFDKHLETTYDDNKSVFGCMFDVYARGDLIVQSFESNFSSTGNIDVQVYYKTGTHVGFESNSAAWTLIGNTTITNPNPAGTPTLIPAPINQPIQAGDTVAFYITTTNTTIMKATNGTGLGNLAASDAIIDVFEGSSMSSLFGSPTSPVIWNGAINYFTYAGITYQWSTGDTTTDITVRPTQSSRYNVHVKDTSGCGNDASVRVIVTPAPTADAGADEEICLGESLSIQANAGGTYSWSPTAGLSDSTSLNPTVIPDDDISYILSVLDTVTGCYGRDTLTITVTIANDSEDSIALCIGDQATLQLPETTGSVYAWSTGDSTSSLVVTAGGTYTARYFSPATDCGSMYTFIVSDLDCEELISVPQAFTPNDDGVNDYFTVYGKNIEEYTIKIFNRWGELVYESSDPTELNDLGRGWDGRHKGALQNVGTFVYYIKARDMNGIAIERQGNLTLIR